MRIYRGSVGIEMTLDEFSSILSSEESIDDMLNILEVLELEQIMQYDKQDIEEFEQQLLDEMEARKQIVEEQSESSTMRRILQHLKRYE